MAIILDSDVVIEGECGRFDLQRWMVLQSGEEFHVAAITVAELWHGVERATIMHRAKRQLYIESILELMHIVPYTEETARVHAHLWAKLESSGTMIGDYDLIVAATALERGSAVATFNRRHFDAVPGLTVIEPELR